MKTFLLGLVCLVIFSMIAHAQEKNVENSVVSVGLGVAIGPETVAFSSSGETDSPDVPLLYIFNFVVPIRFQHFKIEPEIGYAYFTYSEPLFSGRGEDDHASIFRVGTGIYYLIPAATGALAYVGPKFGVQAYNQSQKEIDSLNGIGIETRTDESSRTDLFLGLTFGGEYLFTRAFSLGVEAEVEYLSHGSLTVTHTATPSTGTSSPTPPSPTGYDITTKASVIARVYF